MLVTKWTIHQRLLTHVNEAAVKDIGARCGREKFGELHDVSPKKNKEFF